AAHALLVGHQALREGARGGPTGLARAQSAVGQHAERLPGGVALPPHADAPVPGAGRGSGDHQAGAPPAVARRHPVLPPGGRAGAAARGAPRVSGRTKLALVAGGYVAALLVALGVVAVYVSLTSGPDRQASSGMYAFGDSLLFLGVLGVASVPASAVAVTVAVTGIAALVVYLGSQSADPAADSLTATFHAWSGPAVLRILVSPLCALAFGVAAVPAPSRGARILLGLGCLAEAIVFAWIAFVWARMLLSP